MKIIFVEYDKYYIGFANQIKKKDAVLEYVMEICKMFLKNKRLYIFFKAYACVLTRENVKNVTIQIKIAGEFTNLNLPNEVGPFHHIFKFNEKNTAISITASMNKITKPKLKKDLENRLPLFSKMCFLAEFDVLKIESY